MSTEGLSQATHDLDPKARSGKVLVPTNSSTGPPGTLCSRGHTRANGGPAVGSPHPGSNPHGNVVDDAPRVNYQSAATGLAHGLPPPISSGPRGSKSNIRRLRLATTRGPQGPRKMGNRISQSGRGTSLGTCHGGSAEGCRASVPRGGTAQSDAGSTPSAASGHGSGRRRGSSIIREKRESLARESQAIAQKLHLLQSTGLSLPAAQVIGQPTGTLNLPPHLLPTTTQFGTTQDYNLQNQGLAEPSNYAHGLAEPPNHTQSPPSGAPRPEEAGRELSP